ncbi:NAD(P)-binding protein [Mollisia scopiformis]|uniref:NAD(P)-binding protein n=1 Tax=Mollisia scopiformis TaxID=149040 RepID=A0A194WZX2_MOLSC|nr:NAD(P)-binding protein [Mollisia scopiformis]KUJ13254.1 NAD(P)-binding protein [Mollisia scopiformis]
MRRNLLVTGATGKQGQALIRALLQSAEEFQIYALTRKISSPIAQNLASIGDSVTVVEGDLDDTDSIVKIFEKVRGYGGMWGVFAVLAFPGLGNNADGEERQGKLLADIAFHYRVHSFVYSSSFRAGEKYEAELMLSGRAKANIELRCMELGQRGFPWTIIRPGFFMENFNDFIGSISASVLKKGLKDDTEASDDIGKVAAGVFRNHEKFRHRILAVVGEFATMNQVYESHKLATGKPMPAVPSGFGWLILKMNKATQELIEHCEKSYHARMWGEYPTWESEWQAAKEAGKMKTCYEWFGDRSKDEGRDADWNKVSVGKLMVGRS